MFKHFAYMYISVSCVYSGHGEEDVTSMELKIQRVFSQYKGTGNNPGYSTKTASAVTC